VHELAFLVQPYGCLLFRIPLGEALEVDDEIWHCDFKTDKVSTHGDRQDHVVL